MASSSTTEAPTLANGGIRFWHHVSHKRAFELNTDACKLRVLVLFPGENKERSAPFDCVDAEVAKIGQALRRAVEARGITLQATLTTRCDDDDPDERWLLALPHVNYDFRAIGGLYDNYMVVSYEHLVELVMIAEIQEEAFERCKMGCPIGGFPIEMGAFDSLLRQVPAMSAQYDRIQKVWGVPNRLVLPHRYDHPVPEVLSTLASTSAMVSVAVTAGASTLSKVYRGVADLAEKVTSRKSSHISLKLVDSVSYPGAGPSIQITPPSPLPFSSPAAQATRTGASVTEECTGTSSASEDLATPPNSRQNAPNARPSLIFAADPLTGWTRLNTLCTACNGRGYTGMDVRPTAVGGIEIRGHDHKETVPGSGAGKRKRSASL